MVAITTGPANRFIFFYGALQWPFWDSLMDCLDLLAPLAMLLMLAKSKARQRDGLITNHWTMLASSK